MRFVNREVSTPNKKILTVEDVSYNQTTGEISQLIVIEANNEGDVTVEGTKLNATNLNNAFEDLNRNKFLHFYYKEVFGILIGKCGEFEAAASSRGLNYYHGLPGYSKVASISPSMASKLGWASNYRYVSSVMKYGGTIYNLGGPNTGSYAKELILIGNYAKLINLF